MEGERWRHARVRAEACLSCHVLCGASGDRVRGAWQFYKRCPLDEHLTCVRWGDETRGVPRKKKAGAAGADKARTGNKFDHCCFVSMSLPNGEASHLRTCHRPSARSCPLASLA